MPQPTELHQTVIDAMIRLAHAQEADCERKQEVLKTEIGQYTLTQIHILSCIEKNDLVNNRVLSDTLSLSRAAISKAVGKLWDDNLIESYQSPNNQKSIYYRTTAAGSRLSAQHDVLHNTALKSYLSFLDKFDEKTLQAALQFINGMANFLEKR